MPLCRNVTWVSAKPRMWKLPRSPGAPPDETPGMLLAASSTLRKPRVMMVGAVMASRVAGVSLADRFSRLPVGVNCSSLRTCSPVTTTSDTSAGPWPGPDVEVADGRSCAAAAPAEASASDNANMDTPAESFIRRPPLTTAYI